MASLLEDCFTDCEVLNSGEFVQNDDSLVMLGDSLSYLCAMKTGCADLIFVDPPYNLGKDFGRGNDHWGDAEDYVKWCKSWIDECMRILKPKGVMYFMAATQFMPFLDVYVSQNYSVLCRIVWAYDSSGVQSKKMFGSLYEPILMASHRGVTASDVTFNSDAVMVEAKTGAQRKLIDYRKNPPQPYNTKKVPGNVWEFSRVRYRMPEYENHPSQKPEALLERIVLASSIEGDLVLDPFSGSFTTSAVAIKHKRRAVGIDANPDYYKIGIRRTGIAQEYKGELLQKDKGRKTKNLSKRDRNIAQQEKQTPLF